MSAIIRENSGAAGYGRDVASIRVLCCFPDHDHGRLYEQALIGTGVSLLRARHGMHAYWLAIAAKPDLVVIDATQTDVTSDYLLGRLRQNGKLAHIPLLVITHQKADLKTDGTTLQLIDGDVEPEALAQRATETILELEQVQQQNVDAFFSDVTDSSNSATSSTHSIRRTDLPQSQVAARLHQESKRWWSEYVGP